MARSSALFAIGLFLLQLHAAEPRGCPASVPLGTFHLSVQPDDGGAPRPVAQVNVIHPGQKIVYQPLQLPSESKDKAKVSVVMAPALTPNISHSLAVLEPHPAEKAAEWVAPFRVSVLAVVFGPQGLDQKKVRALVSKDEELITQLADYAEQTAQVEALVQTLAAADEGPSAGKNVDAALSGFARQYGVSMTRLDRNAPTDQQAMVLLRALNPALSTYDPLAQQPSQRMQQTAGLAASVAGLFFGSTVGLAAGGALMVQNLRTMVFPDTDFRSALAQPAAAQAVTLCARRQPAKSRTRLAYLWARRIPDAAAPAITLRSAAHLPIGVKSPVPVSVSDWKYIDRAHAWTLAGESGSFPVSVRPDPGSQSLLIDLAQTEAKPGRYRLEAQWDWTSFPVNGELHVHALSDLASARVEADSQDRLMEGSGLVGIKLTGADFQFIEKVQMVNPAERKPQPVALEYALPLGKRGGPQQTLEVTVDTGAFRDGRYQLLLTQPDGSTREVPVRVLPPNPVIENLPIRANLGEAGQKLVLRGSGLERIEQIVSKAADVGLGPARHGRQVREISLRLHDGFRAGERVPVEMKVEGIGKPLELPGALEVIGPRPRVSMVKGSWPDELGVALKAGELPAGSFVSFSVRVENLDPQPTVRLQCPETGKTIQQETLRPGEKSRAARLESSGANLLFLSFDPGVVGQAGCTLQAVVTSATGASDPHPLGRVVRLPRIESFHLTSEKVGEDGYAGILIGQDLETIERAGWDAHSGLPVDGLPRAVAGEGHKQSLRIVLPWPSPAPHAPVYIWLAGEHDGRATKAAY
jgi:hypothetical protein